MPLRFKHRIVEHLKHAAYRPSRPDAIAEAIRVGGDDHDAFDEAISMLVDAKTVVIGKDGLLRLPPYPDELTGAPLAKAAIARYAAVFEQGRRDGTLAFEGTPEDAATALLALLEGLQVLARARRNHASFRRAAATFIDSITARGRS